MVGHGTDLIASRWPEDGVTPAAETLWPKKVTSSIKKLNLPKLMARLLESKTQFTCLRATMWEATSGVPMRMLSR